MKKRLISTVPGVWRRKMGCLWAVPTISGCGLKTLLTRLASSHSACVTIPIRGPLTPQPTNAPTTTAASEGHSPRCPSWGAHCFPSHYPQATTELKTEACGGWQGLLLPQALLFIVCIDYIDSGWSFSGCFRDFNGKWVSTSYLIHRPCLQAILIFAEAFLDDKHRVDSCVLPVTQELFGVKTRQSPLFCTFCLWVRDQAEAWQRVLKAKAVAPLWHRAAKLC